MRKPVFSLGWRTKEFPTDHPNQKGLLVIKITRKRQGTVVSELLSRGQTQTLCWRLDDGLRHSCFKVLTRPCGDNKGISIIQKESALEFFLWFLCLHASLSKESRKCSYPHVKDHLSLPFRMTKRTLFVCSYFGLLLISKVFPSLCWLLIRDRLCPCKSNV